MMHRLLSLSRHKLEAVFEREPVEWRISLDSESFFRRLFLPVVGACARVVDWRGEVCFGVVRDLPVGDVFMGVEMSGRAGRESWHPAY